MSQGLDRVHGFEKVDGFKKLTKKGYKRSNLKFNIRFNFSKYKNDKRYGNLSFA